MYSPTYRHCPFCNGDGTGRWDDLEKAVQQASESEVFGEYLEDDPTPTPTRRGGGKRLLNENTTKADPPEEDGDDESTYDDDEGSHGPAMGRILGGVLALGVIAAAVFLVISIVKPMLGKGDPMTAGSATPTISADPSVGGVESVDPNAGMLPVENDPNASTLPAEGSPNAGTLPTESAPNTSAAPVESGTTTVQSAGAPTAFHLSKEDFTLFSAGQSYQIKTTFEPAGASADVTWKSSDPGVASVTADGTVTAVSKGTTTVTANVAGVGERSCIVRCSLSTTSAVPTATPASNTNQGGGTTTSSASSTLKLNKEDFTLFRKGETFRMAVSGTSSPVNWVSSNPQVATVGSDGTVTGVAQGSCTVTATVDGKTLQCIVRCRF